LRSRLYATGPNQVYYQLFDNKLDLGFNRLQQKSFGTAAQDVALPASPRTPPFDFAQTASMHFPVK
jgi:hypothetical protein